jgi:hypothetical protein
MSRSWEPPTISEVLERHEQTPEGERRPAEVVLVAEVERLRDLANETMKVLLATVADLKADMPRETLLDLSRDRVKRLQAAAAVGDEREA